MFKTWIIDASGRSGTGDLEGAIDRRAAWLDPSRSWLVAPPARARGTPATHVEVVSSPSAMTNVSFSHAVVWMASPSPWPGELSDEAWLSRFSVVIPVIETAADAGTLLPPALNERNAFVKGGRNDWFEVLADDVFSRAVLARSLKSVFISYRRCESLGVARQLAEALTGEGFDVFLDERSIPRGERFDREIRYRLSDADMVVVLATPGFSKSTWVLDEISLASASNIGTLVLAWPGTAGTSAVFPTLMADQLRQLHSVSALSAPVTDQETQQTLTQGELDDVVALIYKQRVAAIARRVDNLLPAARPTPAPVPPTVLEVGDRLGEIVERAAGAQVPERVTLVLPCRPTALAVWEERSRHRTARSVRCVYHEVIPRDRRVRSLDWSLFPHRPAVEVKCV